MNPTPQAIAEAVKQIRAATGLDVQHTGGKWFIVAQGRQIAVTGANAAGFDDILGQAMAAQAPKPAAPSSGPRPVNPGASSRWNPYISAQQTAAAQAASATRQVPTPGGNHGDDDDDWFSAANVSPFMAAARAFAPPSMRSVVFRTRSAIRAARAVQDTPMSPGMIGAGGIGGFALGSEVGGMAGGIGGGIGGAVGMGIGGPVGSAIGGALGSAVGVMVGSAIGALTGSLGKDVARIRETSSLGGQVVDSLMTGVKGAGASVVRVGADIAHQLLDAVAQPFGRSGAALSQFAHRAGGALGGIGSTAFDALGGIGRIGGRVAGAGLGIGGTLLGGAGGALGGTLLLSPLLAIVGGVLGAALGSALGLLAMKVVAAVSQMVGGLLTQFGKLFGEIGVIGGAALRGLIEVISDVTKSASDFARAVSSLHNYSGLSVGRSLGVVNNFGAFGMGAQQTAGMFSPMSQLPSLFKMRASMYGLAGYDDPNFLPSLAGRYQGMARGGLMGQMMARNMMGSLGMDSPQMMALVNLPQDKIRSQLNYSNNLQSSLGMSPQAVQGFAQNWQLLTDRAGMFVDTMKNRLGQELFPYLERALGVATDYVAAHAGEIAGWVKTGVDYLAQFGVFIYANVPVWVMQGVSLLVKGASWFMGAIENVAHSLADNALPILTTMDKIINAFREFGAVGAGVAGAVTEIFGNMKAGVNAMPFAPPATGGTAALSGFLDERGGSSKQGGLLTDTIGLLVGKALPHIFPAVRTVAGAGLGLYASDPMGAYNRAHDQFLSGVKPSNLVTGAGDVSKWLNERGDQAHGYKKNIDDFSARIDGVLKSLGTPATRGKDAQHLADALNGVRDALRKGVPVTVDGTLKADGRGGFIAEIANAVTNQQVLELNRS